MTRAMIPSLRRAGAALALAGLLAACSGGARDAGPGAQEQFAGLDRLFRRGEAPAGTVVLRPDGSLPERLAAELPVRQARALLLRDGRNGAVTTWRTLDAATLSLRDPGVLVATRGLGGGDLHIADGSATAAALAAGRTGEVRRMHGYLGPDRRLTRTHYTCTLTGGAREAVTLGETTRPALRFDETCTGGDTTFTNRYWRDAAGPALLRSEQWIGPELGHIRLQRVVD